MILLVVFMRVKCSKCGNVSEAPLSLTLVHFGTSRYMKCPACGKRSFLSCFVNDPITWPASEREEKVEEKLSDEELRRKRIEESKYEKT
jgi:DNA-directed RNA polymerase subunit RPC12/RpoP